MQISGNWQYRGYPTFKHYKTHFDSKGHLSFFHEICSLRSGYFGFKSGSSLDLLNIPYHRKKQTNKQNLSCITVLKNKYDICLEYQLISAWNAFT